MKLGISSCLVLAATIAKVSGACFSTNLGYPCCTSTKTVAYVDDDGLWGIENNNWCGIEEQTSAGQWTGQNQGYPACSHCNVSYVDGDGEWGVQNNDWCGIKKTCSNKSNVSQPTQQQQQQQQPAQQQQTQTTTSNSNYPANPPPVSGGAVGKTTRYWDCCVASCSWKENTNASHPVNVCQKDGKTVYPSFDWTIGNVCDGGKNGYMCNDNQPWAINDNLAYGFVAASLSGQGSQKDWCCSCQRLEFTSGPVKGKQMVVQVTNTGGDLGENHFDIQMPGGGLGIFDGCTPQWGNASAWGERYGGLKSADGCSALPKELQEGCKWRFEWFQNADNPGVTFERVQCPKELTDITGCIPRDDANQKKVPW